MTTQKKTLSIDAYREAVRQLPLVTFKVRGLRLDFSGKRKHKPIVRTEIAHVVRKLKDYWSVVPVDVLNDNVACARLARESTTRRLAGFQRVKPEEIEECS